MNKSKENSNGVTDMVLEQKISNDRIRKKQLKISK